MNQKMRRVSSEMAVARINMQSLLEQMRNCGVELFVDGRTALPGEAAAKAVCETVLTWRIMCSEAQARLNRCVSTG